MYQLQRLNVIKVVDSELKKEKLIKMGFVEMQTPQISLDKKESTTNYENMKWQDLRKYAIENGIDISGLKKDEIIGKLHELEG